jgi:multicomponent Na+:H+ antiporter subunit E
VAWLSHKLALLNSDFQTLRFNLNLPKFLPWFFIELVKSNLDVSWRILHPTLSIQPNISTVPITKHSEVGKAVYANCITLTPGTYSIDINSAVIEVHSLTKNLAHDLQRGEMSKRILALESTSAKTSKL